jgi:hypothetical protein
MQSNIQGTVRLIVSALGVLPAMSLAFGFQLASAPGQKAFQTPQAVMTSLVTAVKSRDTAQVVAILGPEMAQYAATRDKHEDEIDRQLFLEGSRNLKMEKSEDDPNKVIAYLGLVEWPFPAPLIKTPAGWKFDGKAGLEAVKDRHIGRNELAVIAACLAYVDAQLDYFSWDRQGDGFLQFAQKINSDPGKFDGLYWSSAQGEDLSPIGPFAAEAAETEATLAAPARPGFGYYFKILSAQGEGAKGGARSYLVGNRMLAGFALVAWPAEYKVSGISTFIVNQQGVIYQKDLGSDTARIARTLNQFNPDSSWTEERE